MRFHVVGLPHTSVTEDFTACAFTHRVRKFCNMLHDLDHTVYLYAGPYNDARVTEHIPCITEEKRANYLGGVHYTAGSFNENLPHWRSFNATVIETMGQRIEPRDFICVIGGLCHKSIVDAFPANIGVEFSIGYPGHFAKFRVWESYAWMHANYGPNANGIWFDDVIPGSFDPEDFPFRDYKDDYHLFVGRLTDRKGYQIAADVCEKLGKRLIIAGQGIPPTYGEFVGVVGTAERGRLMAGAQAVWMPTVYIEPFGNVAVEAQMCGTPVIATDWGAATETVIEGVTGFRCRTFGEFVEAVENVGKLIPMNIRHTAMARYSTKVVAKRYQRYFERLETLWGDGWYATKDREI